MKPRKGYAVRWEFSGGMRKIIPNPKILALEVNQSDGRSFEDQYATLEKTAIRTSVSIPREQFVPVASLATIRMRARGRWLWPTRDRLGNRVMTWGRSQKCRRLPERLSVA